MNSLLTALGLASPGPCDVIGGTDVLAVDPPAILVLGERHGTQPDLWRANRVVRRLSRRGSVTLAIEAVHTRYQPVLDRYARGEVDATALPAQLEWESSWGFPWGPYASLVTAARRGVHVVAAGLDLGPAPTEGTFGIPEGYASILEDSMADHPVPKGLEDGFVRSMAWRDYSIATNAVHGWDGQGYLVILTGRGHVEGGKGVAWQAQALSHANVASFLLAWAHPACYAGDRVWHVGPLG